MFEERRKKPLGLQLSNEEISGYLSKSDLFVIVTEELEAEENYAAEKLRA